MAATKDSFSDLERHRELLEKNVEKLSEALDEWRQWKAEYVALRKRVQSLPPEAPREALRTTRETYTAELVNAKELHDIFGNDDSKSSEQVLSVLTNRLDYVTKNVDTLTKQLQQAENKLAQVNVISHPDATDEEGLPITEIVEELDDDDNVISYNLRRPGESQPQLLEALKNAGLEELAETRHSNTTEKNTSDQVERPKSSEKSEAEAVQKQAVPKPGHTTTPSPSQPIKKKVAFADDTKTGDEAQSISSSEKVEELMRQAKEQENIISDPSIPTDESEEEAQLRRDMLKYNLTEMNPIVAELDLEEGSFSDAGSSSVDYDEDEEDDGDVWSRSKYSAIDDDYHQKMKDLQERLNRHALGNQEDASDGGQEEGLNSGKPHGGTARGLVQSEVPANGESKSQAAETTQGNPKKSVRFAQSLDIADESGTPREGSPKQPRRPDVDPLSDVVEHKRDIVAPSVPATKKRTSRFRMQRADNTTDQKPPIMSNGTPIIPELPRGETPIAPSGPRGKTLANSVIEHEVSSDPKEPDELDASLLQQEVAFEFQQQRNKMIQMQGGFMKEDESPIRPLDESEGGPKRMSRFKAARLARS